MTAAVELRPAATPGRVGQGTAVEQSRAVAEVHAAIVVAQQVPRNTTRAERDMERACARKELAAKAFFRFRRGGEQISGETVQLARELARCWGNIQYGLTELRRDDGYGQSEMQAWAWDVETNARASTTFIVPHRRDRSQEKGGPVTLTDMRDIYENNANHGARRLREMIFAVLPVWYIAAAVEACYETLAKGEDGAALSTDRAVAEFGRLGIKAEHLEQKLGAPRSVWTARDMAELRVIYDSITRGEVRKEDEFPAAADRVTAADITGPAPQAPAAQDDTQPSGEPQGGRGRGNRGAPPPAPQDRKQRPQKSDLARVDELLRKIPLGNEDDRTVFLEWVCGGPYTAARKQIEDVTTLLEAALNSAQGDVEEAASEVWRQYRAAQGQDAAEAAQDSGAVDGEEAAANA